MAIWIRTGIQTLQEVSHRHPRSIEQNPVCFAGVLIQCVSEIDPRFLGRQEYVADWFGEKLSDSHVSSVFEETFRSLAMSPSFAMLACDTAPPPGYVLYIDSPAKEDLLFRAADMIDAGLRANFHYDYARRLGQLGCVRPFRVLNGASLFLRAEVQNGRRLGNVKIPALDRRNGWTKIFSDAKRDKSPGSVSCTSPAAPVDFPKLPVGADDARDGNPHCAEQTAVGRTIPNGDRTRNGSS